MSVHNFIPLKKRIHELVKGFKVLETEQIYRYFKGCSIESINHAIKTLKMEGFIYQSQSNKLTSINRAYADVRPDEASVKAFYALVSFGYENISFFDVVKFPKQILFVANNKLYEIAVMTDDNETVLKAILKQEKYKNISEAINIIVVNTPEAGEEMINNYGFDAYCIIDSNNEAVFCQK